MDNVNSAHHTSVRGPDDLQQYIEQRGIAARLIRNLGDTSTVPLAAAALRVEVEQIIKTLLFLVEQPVNTMGEPRPVLVIANGES